MPRIAETLSLVDSIVRLRRAERMPQASDDVSLVRRRLESQLGPTLSRSRASRVLGVSQTALDRWVGGGQIPTVTTPSGRREVPRQVVIELRESLDRLRSKGITRHPLGTALAERRDASVPVESGPAETREGPQPIGHDTADRRGLAYHRTIAERLDDGLVAEARERVERLVADGHMHPAYAERWRGILDLPSAQIAASISEDSQDARNLRQNSPFAGVLNEHERRRIIESIR